MTLKKNRPKNIQFDVISIFPKFFDSFLGESLIKKAREKGLIRVEIHNLRDFAEGKHKKVDDKPFGGGPGMVLQLPPVYQAVEAAKSKKGKPIAERLADEILLAEKNEGEAIKKKQNVHRMAEANRAFAHFTRR